MELLKTRNPTIPRHLALQLRGAYEKLRDRRSKCARGEALILHCQEQLAIYGVDPARFAQVFSPGAAIDFCPEGTCIAFTFATLTRYQSEIHRLKSDLAVVEAECAHTEQEVLAQLATREPRSYWCRWPEKPNALEQMRTRQLDHLYLYPQATRW